MKDNLIEVHLKWRMLWWDGEKVCGIREFCGTLKTLHLEVVDGQSYVVAPFTFPDKYGCDSIEGLLFPIKESTEWVEEIKSQQAQLPKNKKEDMIHNFMEEYRDFCRSDDKNNWIPKKIRELLKKEKV